MATHGFAAANGFTDTLDLPPGWIMISATIVWQRGDQTFTDNRYSRRHRWQVDGGLEIAASSSPDIVRPPLSDPTAIDPEEAFVASLSSCHMLWFLSIAATRGFCVDQYRDEATGQLGRNEDGKTAVTIVTLYPEAVFSGEHRPSPGEIEEMHDQAHRQCFIANSVRTTVRCEPVNR